MAGILDFGSWQNNAKQLKPLAQIFRTITIHYHLAYQILIYY